MTVEINTGSERIELPSTVLETAVISLYYEPMTTEKVGMTRQPYSNCQALMGDSYLFEFGHDAHMRLVSPMRPIIMRNQISHEVFFGD